MNLFGRTLALCALTAGATLALGDIFFVPNREPLPHQLIPFGFPAVEGPLGGTWGYGKVIGEHRFIARLDHSREPLGLIQSSADGRGTSWWGNFSPRQRVLFTDGPWMGATWVFLAEAAMEKETLAAAPEDAEIAGFMNRVLAGKQRAEAGEDGVARVNRNGIAGAELRAPAASASAPAVHGYYAAE